MRGRQSALSATCRAAARHAACALAWVAWKHHKRPFTPAHHVPLELAGLYWHLVDVIWIFLWPLLYLTR